MTIKHFNNSAKKWVVTCHPAWAPVCYEIGISFQAQNKEASQRLYPFEGSWHCVPLNEMNLKSNFFLLSPVLQWVLAQRETEASSTFTASVQYFYFLLLTTYIPRYFPYFVLTFLHVIHFYFFLDNRINKQFCYQKIVWSIFPRSNFVP